MPELKRNFMKGRMNKDLDERLISDGEYRDALNIQVSTAEGSDVGSARNLPSNKSLGLLKFGVPYIRKFSTAIPVQVGGSNSARGGISRDHEELSTLTAELSSNAEVVGAITDEKENKVYSLIASATDYETRPVSVKTTNEDVASGSGTTYVLDSDISASVDVGDVVVGTGTTDVLQGTTVVSITGTTVVLSKSHTTLADGDTLQFHTPVTVGRKSDVILEYTPDSFVSGAAEMKPVFVDIYEIKADWGATLGDALANTFNTAYIPNSYQKREDVIYEHTTLNPLHIANGIELGMQVDAVDVNGDSLWAGTYDGVFVTDIDQDNAVDSGGTAAAYGMVGQYNRARITLNKQVILTDAQVKAGAVLKFTKEKILNFQTGTSYSYSNQQLTPTTVSSYTPESTKITGLDIVDSMLFIAADNDEPKKINITKGIQGSKMYGVTGVLSYSNVYRTTRYIYDSDNDGGSGNVSIKEVMVKDDVTVCRLGPLTPPTLWMRDTSRVDNLGRDAIANEIGLGGEMPSGTENVVENCPGYDFYVGGTLDVESGPVQGDFTGLTLHELWVDPSGGYSDGHIEGNSYFDMITARWPYYDIDDNNASGAWRDGDKLHLHNPHYGFKVTVVIAPAGVYYEQREASFGHREDSVTKVSSENRYVVQKIKCYIIEANDAYKNAIVGAGNQAPSKCAWVAYLDENRGTGEQGVLFREKFVRFAYRYRYNDGEVSPISPFSNPAWIPAAPYIYNTFSESNIAMFNGLKWLAITDFIGGNEIRDTLSHSFRRGSFRPIDVKSVDILYKEDGNSNVYLLKNIDKGSDITGAPDDLNNPSSSWWHSGFDGGDHQLTLPSSEGPFSGSSKRGFYRVTGNTAGRVIPNMQVFRPYDDVPRNVKSQCVSSSRLIYSNYKTQYDLTDKNDEKIVINYNKINGVPSTSARPLYGGQGIGVYNYVHKGENGKPKPSLKRDREYTVGLVFKDRYGRESSVVTGNYDSIKLAHDSHRSGVSQLQLHIEPDGTYPYWAEYYKYFIKESSNEYYNIPLYAAYPASLKESTINGIVGDYAKEYWLVFDSKDRNKIQDDTILTVSKALDHYGASSHGRAKEYPVMGISNEAPNSAKLPDASDHPNPELPPETVIRAEDKKGKFFVKVKADTSLIRSLRTPIGPNIHAIGKGNTMIFQTKPDPVSADLNIYYEASAARPMKLWKKNIEDYISVGDKCIIYWWNDTNSKTPVGFGNVSTPNSGSESGYGDPNRVWTYVTEIKGADVKGQDSNRIKLNRGTKVAATSVGIPSDATGAEARFIKKDGSFVTCKVNIPAAYFAGGAAAPPTPANNINQTVLKYNVTNNAVFELKSDTWGTPTALGWYNCFSYDTGVESDRIGDKFNAIRLDRGVKVSAPSDNYQEQERKHGLTFSGLYNSKNGINNLNQFIAAEGITKDLNPEYGSIQKLFSRNTDIVAFCEDKILKILSSKDALFNADGNTNMTATNRVLGQAIPFAGDHGISTNPESFASNEFRCYFTDRARGSVLRLSRDGITKISDIGMKNYFADNLKSAVAIVGSFNARKTEYDITIHSNINTTASTKDVNTVSFNEDTNGWVSFRAYALEQGVSLNNTYYTFKGGELYEHGQNPGSAARNNFYGIQYYSSITPVFNDMPSSVKSFNLINYEGSQARVLLIADDDPNASRSPDQNYQQYYNNVAREGWYVNSVTTDQQTGKALEFKEKEGKWFNKLQGEATSWTNTVGGGTDSGSGNLDSQEFSFQGVGIASSIATTDATVGTTYTITTTCSCGSANAPTITGDADTVITGTNINTVTSTITVTAADGFVLGDLNISSFPTTNSITPTHLTYNGVNYDASTDIPSAGQTSITVTVVWPSATISASGSWTIPFTMTSQALIDHDLILILEYKNPSNAVLTGYNVGLSENYFVTSPSTSNESYTVGLVSDATSTIDANFSDASFLVEALNINPTLGSQQIASFTVTANDGSSFTAANLTTLGTLFTDEVVDDATATSKSKLMFSRLQNNTSGTTGLELSSDDNEYNVTTTPTYNFNGDIESIEVKIFYNPSSASEYANADILRIPYLTIASEDTPQQPSPENVTKQRLIFEIQDLNSDSNKFGIGSNTAEFGLTSPTVHTEGSDKFVIGGGWMNVVHEGPLITADETQVHEDSQTLSQLMGGSFTDIELVPDAGYYINVSTINSWLGHAKTTNTNTSNGIYAAPAFADDDGGVDLFGGGVAPPFNNVTTLCDNTVLAAINNTVSNIPPNRLIKKVQFINTGTAAQLTTEANSIIMRIFWIPGITLAGQIYGELEEGATAPHTCVQLQVLLDEGKESICSIPLPIIADNLVDVAIASTGENHRYSAKIDEISYLIFKTPLSAGSKHEFSKTNEKVGYRFYHNEQTDYQAYVHNPAGEPDTLGSAITSGSGAAQTLAQQCTAGKWTNESYGMQGIFGSLESITVEGEYSSGTKVTHKFKYEINSAQIDSTDLEFVWFEAASGNAFTLTNDATLQAFAFAYTQQAVFKGSEITQLNSYTAQVAGTYSGSKCIALEFTISYTDDGIGAPHTDSDYHLDPLVFVPSNGSHGCFAFRKQS